MILHDWALDDAASIILNIIPALKRGSKIIIMNTILPDPGSVSSAAEQLLRVRGLTMMQFFNSQERTIGDWKAIFRKVNSQLEVQEVN